MNQRRSFMTACLAVAALSLAGCGGPGTTASPGATATAAPTATGSVTPSGGAPTSVDVTVQEFAVLPAVATAKSGEITFVVTNTGPDDIHEFVVLRTDLAPDALPTDARGVVDEEREGITVVDELEDLEVGTTEELTVTLEPGAYVLVCNIFDETEQEAHYQMGMYTGFMVTE